MPDPSPAPPPTVTVDDLFAAHAALFLDAYGVLVDGHGALPGAREAIAALNARGQPYLVLTNDASRSPETAWRRFAGLGLDVPRERILSSGELIAPFFAARGLRGARCVVLGTPDSVAYVAAAGGEVVPPSDDGTADVVVVCDEAGFPFLPTVEAILSMLFRTVEAGRTPALLLPNPDLIYPKRGELFGLAAGSIALVLEAALALRFPSAAEDLRFVRLGKPHAPIFEEACRRVGTRDAVMVGDQLLTDVRGARDFGIASALVGTGLTRPEDVAHASARPTYYLPSLLHRAGG